VSPSALMRTDDVEAVEGSHARVIRAWLLCGLLLGITQFGVAWATPRIPTSDAEVLAELPPGATHASLASRQLARTRLDVALPLAQFYISRARATGDLRYLGYAEAALTPWLNRPSPPAAVLVLDATVLQSRHAFAAALTQLNRALQAEPGDAQAWLTRATVLRVLGRYDEAMSSCGHLRDVADEAVTSLCEQSIRGLTGHLQSAYEQSVSLPQQSLPREVRAWRYSELGEMAERLGNDAAAEHWLIEGLQLAPEDFYMRTAYADLLLRHDRAMETLRLLSGYESLEPMLLRVAIAEKKVGDGHSARMQTLLADAFDVEQQRGDAVHRREQARFLLDVEQRPAAALAVAQENWRVQREPDDVLILLRAAHAATRPDAVVPVMEFLRERHLEDARLDPYRSDARF